MGHLPLDIEPHHMLIIIRQQAKLHIHRPMEVGCGPVPGNPCPFPKMLLPLSTYEIVAVVQPPSHVRLLATP